MPMSNPEFVVRDVNPVIDQALNQFQGYTQRAQTTTPMGLLLGQAKPVVFTSIPKIGPGAPAELTIGANGQIFFPAGVIGRWSVSGAVNVSIAANLTANVSLTDEAGVALALEDTGYPQAAYSIVPVGGRFVINGLTPVPKVTTAAGMYLKLELTATLALNVTRVDLNLTKFP